MQEKCSLPSSISNTALNRRCSGWNAVVHTINPLLFLFEEPYYKLYGLGKKASISSSPVILLCNGTFLVMQLSPPSRHSIPLWKIEEDEVGGACGTNGGEEERL
jgi:hypothetical protein